MALLILKQLAILLWKSWIMRKAHYISSIFELIFPLVISIIIVSLRANATRGAEYSSSDSSNSWKMSETKYNTTEFDYKLENLFYNNQNIYYAPNNSMTDGIMKTLEDTYKAYNLTLYIIPFVNEATLAANLTTQAANSSGYSKYGIVFDMDNYEGNNYHFKYKIRLSDYLLNSYIDKLYPVKYTAKPYGGSSPYEDRFTKIQVALNEAYLNYISKSKRQDSQVYKVSGHKFPYPSYIYSGDSFGNK